MIYNAHTAHADVSIHSRECLELAKLASVAVDFMKSGTPVEFPVNGRLQPSRWPDYMEKRHHYKSPHVLGQMFRYITPTPAYEECEL
jgi:RNA-dependent RNA polymerase